MSKLTEARARHEANPGARIGWSKCEVDRAYLLDLITRMRAAMERSYGGHAINDCHVYFEDQRACNCGWDALLEESKL